MGGRVNGTWVQEADMPQGADRTKPEPQPHSGAYLLFYRRDGDDLRAIAGERQPRVEGGGGSGVGGGEIQVTSEAEEVENAIAQVAAVMGEGEAAAVMTTTGAVDMGRAQECMELEVALKVSATEN